MCNEESMYAKLPMPWEVPLKVEQLLAECHSEMQRLQTIERTALLHLRFESIHPFIDGNGRTGRLLMNLELMKEGYLLLMLSSRIACAICPVFANGMPQKISHP